MRTAVIVGTGLLGSSFGLAVKKANLFDHVIGVSSPAVVEKALAIGAIDQALPLEAALPQGQFVLLAQPVRRIISLLQFINPHLAPGTLVTDVGSTKADICAAAAAHITNAKFVGGHPMAGRELRGPDGASADLFSGRPWILTESDPTLLSLIEALGGKPVLLDAPTHDRLVALSSHLPQLLSTALGSYLAPHDLKQVAGPGIIDMTRLALSSYDLWEDILLTNAANVDQALADLIAELQALRTALPLGQAKAFFERGAETSAKLRS